MSSPAATRQQAITRHHGLGAPTQGQAARTQASGHDHLITELPVALVFNGISHAVMMATPTHLAEMALGFALSEGLIASTDQCLGIEVNAARAGPDGLEGIEVQLEISARAEAALKQRKRAMEGRTGCGLCGVDSLAALNLQPPPLRQMAAAQVDWAQAAVLALQQLPAHQPLNELTGACHAAAWATPQGQVLAAFEDVGRHNALDKLIGHLAQHDDLGQSGLVVMSSRASVELVRKCAQVQIGVLATISAPTSLAVHVATQAGLHLLGFCRGSSVVAYTCAHTAPSLQIDTNSP